MGTHQSVCDQVRFFQNIDPNAPIMNPYNQFSQFPGMGMMTDTKKMNSVIQDVNLVKKDIRLKNKLVKSWCKVVRGYYPHKLLLMLSLLNSKLSRAKQEDSKV